MHTMMHHLARNENLTSQEKKMRRAIAVLSRSIEEHTGEIKNQVAPGS